MSVIYIFSRYVSDVLRMSAQLHSVSRPQDELDGQLDEWEDVLEEEEIGWDDNLIGEYYVIDRENNEYLF